MARALASLPQYDMPALREATDAWWAGIARHLRREGVADAPAALTRAVDGEAPWRDPALLLTQTCGYPLMTELRDHLRAVAAPIHTCDGSFGPNYSSAIIVRADSGIEALEDLRGARAAINNWNSHSGMNALRHTVARRATQGRFFGEIVVSGGHLLSMEAVREGRADVAAIDGVTWALALEIDPGAREGLRVLTWSDRAPSLPYAVRVEAPDDLAQRVRNALCAAGDDPDLASCRATLLIDGVAPVDNDTYQASVAMRDAAEALGYPELR
jgi:ABC-type phosphate/phosphonate transport system substrate-binding protein